jgi:hypothetical protein
MDVRRVTCREVAAAERGQIIQRVLVDGWTPAEAALLHDVPPRDVARWVAQYRRKGMASLHDARSQDGAALRLIGWLRARLPLLARLIHGGDRQPAPPPCIVFRRTGEERRHR